MTKDRPRGWFVASVRELPWQENELGATCEFDKRRNRFDEFGINLTVLRPGQPMTMYHREGAREGFLILRGECLHGAGVARETPYSKEAYARFTRPAPEVPFGEEFLT